MPGFVVDGSDSFISKLAGGGARASLFNANLIFKGALAENSKTGVMDNKTFGFMCKGVQIPSSAVGIVSVNYMGRAVKLPGNRSFEDMTTTILNDEGYALRNKIENWMNKINSHFGNVRAASHTNKLTGYTATLDIQTRGKAGGNTGLWKLYNVWPTSLDQIDVNWEPNDAIMEYSVTWAYDYWRMDKVSK